MAPAVGHDDGEFDHNTVFIHTSLDTRLALMLSESEIVSDFKKKIVLEHRKLFPAVGDIKIDCLKVKKRGNFYNLVDSMPVKCAFNATRTILFLSADASRLEQNDGIQHSGKPTPGDQLALPWVTHSCSIERHDNHGSPSNHSKVVEYVSQKVLNADRLTTGDSCKDVVKNVEEDKPCNDEQLDHELQEKLYTVNTDISSKKRTRDTGNESSLNDAFESGPSVKKKRKSKRVKSDVIASTHDDDNDDDDKVKDKGASIKNKDSVEHKSKGKDLVDENNRINTGEKCSDLDQVATVVTGIEEVGSENVADVAMVAENNSQKEMPTGISQQEKDSELVKKSVIENEIDSSLMRTSDSAGVTATGHMKRSRKRKLVDKEVFLTAFTKMSGYANNDAIESSSQHDVGSNGQECADDQIDKYKDDLEVSLKQKPELKLPEMKKGNTGFENIGEGKKRKSKKRFKHSDTLLGDVSSTVSASVTDERKMNEDSEKTLKDDKKGDDVIMNEVEVSVEKSRKELIDANDAATVTNEENLLPHSESLVNNDAEKDNENADDTMKRKKKKRSKKSAGRNEDGPITKHVDGDIFENVRESESSLPNADRKDGDTSLTVFDSVYDKNQKNKVSGNSVLDAKKGDDVIVNEVDISVENMGKKFGEEFKDDNDLATVTNNDAEVSTEKMADTMKKKKKKKSKRSSGRNDEESITKHVDGDSFENVKEGESGLPDADKKKGDMSSTVFDSVMNERKMNEVDVSVENIEVKLGEEFKDPNDVATVTNKENLLPETLMNNDVEVSTEKMEDTTKKKRKKKTKKSAGRNEDEPIARSADCDVSENVKEGESSLPDADLKDGDTSLTVFDSVNNEKQTNEASGKMLIDVDKVNDVIVNAVGVSVENMEEKFGEEFKDFNDVATESMMNNDVEVSTEKTEDSVEKKKKKKTKISSGRDEDESVTKHVDGDICENIKEVESSLPDADRKDGDGDLSLTVFDSVNDEKQTNEVSGKMLLDSDKVDDMVENEVEMSVENMEEILKDFKVVNDVAAVTNEENNDAEKQNEKMDNMKKKKKKKSKRSSVRSEDESMAKPADRDASETVTEDEHNFSDVNIKDSDTSLMILASVVNEMNKNLGKTSIVADKGGGDDDVIANVVADETYEEITTGSHSEKIDDTVKKNKKRKTRKSAERIDDESLKKHVNRDISEKVKEGESNKSTEVELESMKSQSVDHHDLPEKTLKNMTASEVPKDNNKVDVPEDASVDNFAPGQQQKKDVSVDDFAPGQQQIKDVSVDDFAPGQQQKKDVPVDDFAPGQQQKKDVPVDDFALGQQPKKNSSVVSRKVKDVKKTKDDSLSNQSQKLDSKNVNKKDSSNEIKTRQMTKKIDAQKTNKQQSSVGPGHVKTVQKKSTNSPVKPLLNQPETIFGEDGDDNATANSDSSTRAPSEKSTSSSSSSSSEESPYIIQSRINRSNAKIGKEDTGKNNINSQKRGKSNYILRSASIFKKIKDGASSQVQDTESQDFVPESQPMGKR